MVFDCLKSKTIRVWISYRLSILSYFEILIWILIWYEYSYEFWWDIDTGLICRYQYLIKISHSIIGRLVFPTTGFDRGAVAWKRCHRPLHHRCLILKHLLKISTQIFGLIITMSVFPAKSENRWTNKPFFAKFIKSTLKICHKKPSKNCQWDSFKQS